MAANYGDLNYSYPVARLWSGASFGNPACFARTDRLSNLDGFWLAATNEWVCGRIDFRLEAGGRPAAPQETRFYPGQQQTSFSAPGLTASKSVFVPYGAVDGTPAFYVVWRLLADEQVAARLTLDVRWPAVVSTTQTKQPELDQRQRRVRQWTEPGLLFAQTVPFTVDRWQRSLGDAQEIRAIRLPSGAQATFAEPGRALLTYDLALAPGEELLLPFTLAATGAGAAALRELLAALPAWEEALSDTVAAYERVLSTALLVTPDARINRGMQWAKANAVRVQHNYRLGRAFTNDPPQDIVVLRDCAWYGLGADWLTPGFVHDMYGFIAAHGVHTGGKLTEYIHADTGTSEDYALNINDDTPLVVVGAIHHYRASGDDDFIQRMYPLLHNACEWMLAQRHEGLIWCSVSGADIWGNATWRNIIPGYNLAGAVTEINALCYWALQAAAELATSLAHDEDATRWSAGAAELRAAIDARLTTPDGLYLLNRDGSGTNATRSADLVFPVLGGLAEGARAQAILDLLYSDRFSTPYGIHTVGQGEAEYHPNFGWGLMGGLWPNLTAWVAYAGRSLYPDRLAAMMSSLYALAEPIDPAAGGHLVPGEFPEYFDGETFVSLGMAMSPWMPPTYVWLGLEGLAGLALGTAGLTVAPNLPPGWHWLALRNLPYRDGSVSLFVNAGRLYTTQRVASSLPQELFSSDISAELTVEGPINALALEGSGIVILVYATEVGQGALTLRGVRREVAVAEQLAMLVHWS